MSLVNNRLARAHAKCLAVADAAPVDYCVEVSSTEPWEKRLFDSQCPIKDLLNPRAADILLNAEAQATFPQLETDPGGGFLFMLSTGWSVLSEKSEIADDELTPRERAARDFCLDFLGGVPKSESEWLDAQLDRADDIKRVANRMRQIGASLFDESSAADLARRSVSVDTASSPILDKVSRRFVVYFSGSELEISESELASRLHRLEEIAGVLLPLTHERVPDGCDPVPRLLALLFDEIGSDHESSSPTVSIKALCLPVIDAAIRMIENLDDADTTRETQIPDQVVIKEYGRRDSKRSSSDPQSPPSDDQGSTTWFDHSPSPISDWHGPIEGNFEQIKSWLNRGTRPTLLKHNGKRYWIQKLPPNKYRCWFRDKYDLACVESAQASERKST